VHNLRWNSPVGGGVASNDSAPLATSKPHSLFLSLKSRDRGPGCSCEFAGQCTCDGAMDFMNCVVTACDSGGCDCGGNAAFRNSCRDMANLCPDIGLSCTLLDDGAAGRATCGARQLTAQFREPTTAAPQRQRQQAEVVAPAPEPAPASEGFFPVPTTSRCIVIICCQYMLIFLALAIIRTYHELSATRAGTTEKALRGCTATLAYGPMLCVLFIACRMRVEFLSNGKDQPQMWVQDCMYACTAALFATSLIVLIIPFVTGRELTVNKDSGDISAPRGEGMGFQVLSILRYAIQLAMYGGIAGVIVGIFIYTPPGQDDVSKLPAPAPAVMCTMILTVIFFVIQLAAAGIQSWSEFSGKNLSRQVGIVRAASDTVSFAPMLCILFLAARMRALQHDGQPQRWAQYCMYASTAVLGVSATLAIIVPLAMGGAVRTDPVTGQTTITVRSRFESTTTVALRYLMLAAMYGGAVGVIVSIYKFEAPAGPQHTLPVSPAVNCVVILCVQYFFIFLALNIISTIKEMQGGDSAQAPANGPQRLQVTIVQATGLNSLSYFTGDRTRCLCVVSRARWADKASKCVTKTVEKSFDPVWNETHELIWHDGESIEFIIEDEGSMGSRTEGSVAVPAERFNQPNGFSGELMISGMPQARLRVCILLAEDEAASGGGDFLLRLFCAVDAARATVAFAPMLAILFVTTRMYALLLTDNKGAPQRWVQDGMFQATWSLLISFILCLVSAMLAGKVQVDKDGNVISSFDNKGVAIAITIVRYLCVLLLYGGIATVIVGLFVMTPQTANGRGSIPYLSDIVRMTPMGNPPPQPS